MGMRTYDREPTLDELLVDPVVRTVMARDHVTPEEIRELFRRLASAGRLLRRRRLTPLKT